MTTAPSAISTPQLDMRLLHAEAEEADRKLSVRMTGGIVSVT